MAPRVPVPRAETMRDVTVVGQVARDLVPRVERMPGAEDTVRVRQRVETLGGKGANQAVSVTQLGGSVALLGVVGDDDPAAHVLATAAADGIDVRSVVRRRHTATGLIVDVVADDARWRYLADLPDAVLLTAADIAANAAFLRTSRAVCVQLQQPMPAVLAAARAARAAGALVVLDGAPPDPDGADELLAAADVVRADAREARSLTGAALTAPAEAIAAGRDLLDRGPALVALAVDRGNVFVWPSGDMTLPLTDEPVVDTTGAGDSFTAALTMALLRGAAPERAARAAVAAAASTVGHAGGRPRLPPNLIEEVAGVR